MKSIINFKELLIILIASIVSSVVSVGLVQRNALVMDLIRDACIGVIVVLFIVLIFVYGLLSMWYLLFKS